MNNNRLNLKQILLGAYFIGSELIAWLYYYDGRKNVNLL